MSLSKAVNYALNAPTLKQLYIPTSKDAKYKAQAWIEMFGSRAAKGVASSVNLQRIAIMKTYGAVDGLSVFLTMTTAASFGLVAVWILVAMFAATAYNKAIKENTIVC